MAFASKRDWDRARPSEIKETGLGKAAEKWTAACKPVGLVVGDKAAEKEALAAVIAMTAALKDARGQVKKVKSSTKRAAVQKLLDEWTEEATEYEQTLKGRILKGFEDDTRAVKAELIAKFAEIFETVSARLGQAAFDLDAAEKAIRARDADAANDKVKAVGLSLRIQAEFVNDPQSVVERAKKSVGKLPPPPMKFTLDDVAEIVRDQKRRFDEISALHAGLKTRAEALIDPDLPGDFETRKQYQATLKAFQEAQSTMFDQGRAIQKLFEETKALTTSGLAPNELSLQAGELRGRVRALESEHLDLYTSLTMMNDKLTRTRKLEKKHLDPLNRMQSQYRDLSGKLGAMAQRCHTALAKL
jgi:hypothetical protein